MIGLCLNSFLKLYSSEFCLNLSYLFAVWYVAFCSFIIKGRNDRPAEYEDVVSGPASVNPTFTLEADTSTNQTDTSTATSAYENPQTSNSGGRRQAVYAQPASSEYEMVHKAENKDDTHVYTMLNC